MQNLNMVILMGRKSTWMFIRTKRSSYEYKKHLCVIIILLQVTLNKASDQIETFFKFQVKVVDIEYVCKIIQNVFIRQKLANQYKNALAFDFKKSRELMQSPRWQLSIIKLIS